MTQKKLIIFIPSIEGGGVEKNLFIITNFLAKKINNISIITTSYQFRKKFDKRINVVLPKNKFWDNFGRISKYFICSLILFRILLFNRNSTVFAFQANLYCIVICKLLSIKIIIRSNSAPDGWSKSFLKKKIFKILINKADRIIVNSIHFKNNMKKKFNVNSTVIYNPLNKKEVLIKSKVKQKKIFPKNCLKIINVGRFVEQKDQLTLLKSLHLIKDKIDFYAVLLGRGILEKKLVSFVEENKLNNKVRFIKYKRNPYPFIKQADIFVLSSKYEGLPNVLLEAAALKKFIISTDCPSGPREILLNGKGGNLIPVGDYRKLSKQLVLFVRNKSINKKLINLTFKNLTRFDLKQNLEKYLDLIISVMRNS